MLQNRCYQAARQLAQRSRQSVFNTRPRSSLFSNTTRHRLGLHRLETPYITSTPVARTNCFSTTSGRPAQSPTADSIMETLNDLYATAKDEFEIAAEETEKQTVYAEDDRQACRQAFEELQGAFEKALKESSPEVAKEVQGRTGPRIRELENAIKNMEEMAMEH